MRVKSDDPDSIFDIDGCLARFGGDRELFAEITGMLLEDAPPLVVRLKVALNDGNAQQIESQAHALKGLLANCGGVRAAQTAQQLEDAGRSQNLTTTGALVEKLDAELDVLFAAIHEYRGPSAEV